MILKVIGFANHGHDAVQNNSASQVSPQTPLATIMSTAETGYVYGGFS